MANLKKFKFNFFSISYLKQTKSFGFLEWWWNEIYGCLPKSFHKFLVSDEDKLFILPQQEALIFYLATQDGTQLFTEIKLNEDLGIVNAILQREKEKRGIEKVKQILLMPNENTLVKKITLPMAAEENIREVLAFEMDSYTPFMADDVLYDYTIIERNKERGQLVVELVVLPKNIAENWLNIIKERSIQLDGIDIISESLPVDSDQLTVNDLPIKHYNLLPANMRASVSTRMLKINAALLLLVFIVYASAMWQSLDYQQEGIEQLQKQVADAKRDARKITDLKKKVIDSIEAANFLSSRKHTHPVITDLLLEATKLLPDDTYIERLRLSEKNKNKEKRKIITLTGQSDSASDLISIFSNSDKFKNASFSNTVSRDRRTKKERFNLELELVEKSEKDGNTT